MRIVIRLFNMVQEMKGNIRVFCRIRPLLKDEKESCIIGQNDQVRVENKLEDKLKMFEFDRVFSPQINQVIYIYIIILVLAKKFNFYLP